MEPLVSIIMPVYNSELYLQKAIESALNQTYSNIELLIIDDGSHDLSPQIARSQAEKNPKIRFFPQKINGGVATARNIGLSNALGDFLVFADSDDLMFSDRVEKSVDYLRSYREIDFVLGSYQAIDRKGTFLNRDFYFPTYLNNDNILLHQLKRNYLWIGLSTIRTDVAQRYRFDENLTTAEDYDFFLRLIFDQHKFAYLNQPVIQYRIHESNTSAKMLQSLQATKYILRKYNFADLAAKLEEHHSYKEIYNCFAVVCMILQDELRGRKFIEQALAESDGSEQDVFESYFYAGVLYYRLGDLEKSYASFMQLLNSGYEEPTFYNNLAVLEVVLKNSQKRAIELLNKALELQPIYNDAAINLRKVESGEKNLSFTIKPLRKKLVHHQNMSYE